MPVETQLDDLHGSVDVAAVETASVEGVPAGTSTERGAVSSGPRSVQTDLSGWLK